MPSTVIKDSDAVLDYMFDWSDWLETGETINAKTVTLTGGGLTKNSDSVTSGTNRAGTTVANAAVVVWLSAGTVGLEGTVACKVTTTGGRTDERTMTIVVRQR